MLKPFFLLFTTIFMMTLSPSWGMQFKKDVPYIPQLEETVLTKVTGTIYFNTFSLLKTRSLKIVDSRIKKIESGALCGSFEKLELHNSVLPEFTGDAFGIRCATLKHLKLSNNPDLIITDTAFSNLPNLEVLEIVVQKNFTRVSSALLANLTSLKELAIGFSGLETIEPGALDNLTQLKNLHLFNNKLTTIDGTLSKLTSLETLNLESNNLGAFPIEELRHVPNLRLLHMQTNYGIKDGVDAEKIVKYLPNLKYINIQHFGLRYCDTYEDIIKRLLVGIPGVEVPYHSHFNTFHCTPSFKTMEDFKAQLAVMKTWLASKAN